MSSTTNQITHIYHLSLCETHFLSLRVRAKVRISPKNERKWKRCSSNLLLKTAKSSTYESLNCRICRKISWALRTNVFPAHLKPNGIRVHSQRPWWVTKAVSHRFSSFTSSCQYPEMASQTVIQRPLPTRCMTSVKFGMGKLPPIVWKFKYR